MLKTGLPSLHTIGEHTDDLARLHVLRDVPVMLVKGADSLGTFWFADSGIVDLLFKSLGPSAKVLVLPDGHACHIITKEEFIAELQRFIAS
jgi:pimeloyl-ACP methyl ester carboxylesterase